MKVVHSKEKSVCISAEVLLLRRTGKRFAGKKPGIAEVVKKFAESTDFSFNGVSVKTCEHRTVQEKNVGVIFFTFSNGKQMVLTPEEFQILLKDCNHIPEPRYFALNLVPVQTRSVHPIGALSSAAVSAS